MACKMLTGLRYPNHSRYANPRRLPMKLAKLEMIASAFAFIWGILPAFASASAALPQADPACYSAAYSALPGSGPETIYAAGAACAGGNTAEAAVECVRQAYQSLPGSSDEVIRQAGDLCRIF